MCHTLVFILLYSWYMQKNAVRIRMWFQGNSSSWQRKLMIVFTILNPNIVLSSIQATNWIGSGKLSMEWNGVGVKLQPVWYVIASRDLPQPVMHALPGREMSGGMRFCLLLWGPYFSSCSRYSILLCFLIFLNSSLWHVPKDWMEKKEKTKKQKKHGGHKIIWLCGIIWSELLFGEGK